MGKNRTAIILLGGGMASAYGAGFLCSLFRKNLFPDIVIATSGNTGNASHYITKEPKVLEYATKTWFESVITEKFINLNRKKKAVDIDYLVDEVFKSLVPINLSAVKESQIKLYIPLMNVKTTHMDFYTNKDNADYLEVLRAAQAVPYYYNKIININGNGYSDLVYLDNFQAFIDICKAEDVSNVIVVNNQEESVRSRFLINIYAAFFINLKFIVKLTSLFSNKEKLLKKSKMNYLYFHNSQIKTFENKLDLVKGAFLKGQIDAEENILQIQNCLRK